MGYKLLTKEMKTRQGRYNEMDWSDVGEWHAASGDGGLCTDGMIHDYDDPWIAVMMNPAHANISDPIMYETERDGVVETDGLKCGCKRLRLVRRVDIPDVPLVQRVAFGIIANLQVHRRPDFVQWAEKWLSGEDRTTSSAVAADAAVTAAAFAAEAPVADAHTAEAAHYATCAAAHAAYAAGAYAAGAYAAAAAAAHAAYADDDAAAASAAEDGNTIGWQAIKAKAMQIV